MCPVYFCEKNKNYVHPDIYLMKQFLAFGYFFYFCLSYFKKALC